MPATTPARDAAVKSDDFVPLIAHQAAAAAGASIPIVVFVARLPASAALAAIPVVMHQAMKVHRFPVSSGKATTGPRHAA